MSQRFNIKTKKIFVTCLCYDTCTHIFTEHIENYILHFIWWKRPAAQTEMKNRDLFEVSTLMCYTAKEILDYE